MATFQVGVVHSKGASESVEESRQTHRAADYHYFFFPKVHNYDLRDLDINLFICYFQEI